MYADSVQSWLQTQIHVHAPLRLLVPPCRTVYSFSLLISSCFAHEAWQALRLQTNLLPDVVLLFVCSNSPLFTRTAVSRIQPPCGQLQGESGHESIQAPATTQNYPAVTGSGPTATLKADKKATSKSTRIANKPY